MPGKLSITVGLPGSGKTHCAKLMQEDNPDDVVLLSRDDYRASLYNGVGILSPEAENFITQCQETAAKALLRKGKHVIVHDMNLREKYRKRWATIAFNQGADFDIIDLTSVDLAVCVSRDLQRTRTVGGDVIRKLHRKFIAPLKGAEITTPVASDYLSLSYETYVPDLSKPKAIIVDIDGTVADCEGIRSPYDYSRVKFDKPKEKVIRLVQDMAYKMNYKILFVSGRLALLNSQCYKDTEEWLYQHVKVPIEMLKMRAFDGIDDTVVKAELFNIYIRKNYNVQFVLDDRDRVVDMWRSMGLLTLQVERGDF